MKGNIVFVIRVVVSFMSFFIYWTDTCL